MWKFLPSSRKTRTQQLKIIKVAWWKNFLTLQIDEFSRRRNRRQIFYSSSLKYYWIEDVPNKTLTLFNYMQILTLTEDDDDEPGIQFFYVETYKILKYNKKLQTVTFFLLVCFFLLFHEMIGINNYFQAL